MFKKVNTWMCRLGLNGQDELFRQSVLEGSKSNGGAGVRILTKFWEVPQLSAGS